MAATPTARAPRAEAPTVPAPTAPAPSTAVSRGGPAAAAWRPASSGTLDALMRDPLAIRPSERSLYPTLTAFSRRGWRLTTDPDRASAARKEPFRAASAPGPRDLLLR